MYSVIIPTNRPIEKIIPTLFALSIQVQPVDKIYLLLDIKASKWFEQLVREYKSEIQTQLGDFAKKILIISELDTSFKANLGVSYVRNYGFSLVDSPLVLSIDDDNIVDTDFCARLIQTRKEIKKTTNKSAVLVPTEKHKWKIRSRGYRRFSYFLGIQRPVAINIFSKRKIKYFAKEAVLPIQFSSSNCLFGATKTFQYVPFDERMEFIYEDMDLTQRITKAGYPMYVLLDLFINHEMRDKIPLEKSYLATPKDVYQKSRNRSIMVKNSADVEHKIVYFLFGLWIHSVFIFQKIIRFAPKTQRKLLLRQLRKGTRDGVLGKY